MNDLAQQSAFSAYPETSLDPIAILQGANARGWSPTEEENWRRKQAARKILADEIECCEGWQNVLDHPMRGEIAARLYATWAPRHRDEPIVESEYLVTGIYADLAAAMNANGLDTFDGRCMEIGKKIVLGAIAYVLKIHENDAEAVERELIAQRSRN